MFFQPSALIRSSTLYLSFIAFGAVGLLSGCGGSSASNAGDKVFNYVNIDEPKHLDPALTVTLYEGLASALLYDGLVNFGKGSDIVPGLAEKHEISPDGKTYTFHLRTAHFSDGTSVTSADVRHSFTRILRPETGSDRKWLFADVLGADEVSSGTTKVLRGLETPDDRTVVIKLRRPNVAFLTMLAMPNAVIVPVKASGEDKPNPEFDKKPVATGPWVLDKWTHDMRLEFLPNPHYWGTKPKLTKFNFNIQSDDTVQRQQFKIGKYDIYPTVGFTVFEQWKKDPATGDRMQPSPELNTYFVGIMCSKPHLKDKRVRQAISHAINTREIFQQIQMGRGELAHGGVPLGIEGYRPELTPREFNPERAKQLLKEAGAENLNLNLWVRTEAQTDEMAAAIQADLAKVGIKVQINKRDHAAMNEATYNGQPDLFIWSWWLDYPDIENALEPCFHSRNIPRQGNRAHFSNPEVDRLIDEAKLTADPKKRIETFQKAEDLIIEESPWVPLYHRKSYSVIQPWVIGYSPAVMYNASRYTEVDIDLSKKK